MRLVPKSLAGRLLLGGSVLILAALLATAAMMGFALYAFVRGQVDGRLDGQILTVTEALRVGNDGTLLLSHSVDGPPFERTYSGWYWQVMAPAPVLRSQSLLFLDFRVASLPPPDRPKLKPGPAPKPKLKPEPATGTGPWGEPLRVRFKRVSVGGKEVTIAAGAPLEALAGPWRHAMLPLAGTFAFLAVVLLAGVAVMVRLGLRPLRSLRTDLLRVRTGRAERICTIQPSEIMPLVMELNTLLEQNSANLERARRHVANLAHGLKTPLATLALALQEPGIDPDHRLRPLVGTVDRRMRHHLARARSAALGGHRARTDVAARVADHLAVFTKLYAERNIRFTNAVPANLAVACETQDVDEMLGNLIDNACKWAGHSVWISAAAVPPRVLVVIEDDGPGLQSAGVDVMRPGVRIDESAPGYGFGLPITRELTELYGGAVDLSASSHGGLKVTLDLPAA